MDEFSRYHGPGVNTTTQSFLRTRKGLSYNAPALLSVKRLGAVIACD